MLNYYDLDIIPIILKQFKVKNIVIGGSLDQNVFEFISEYCKDNDTSYIQLTSNNHENSLDTLPNFSNYDAIFLDDDPNWYTVYNELNIIKDNNDMFPLVFICNNVFPHKRRDSYYNPNRIPKEYINEYSNTLNYNNIEISDGLYHAINENTPKNGVLTAIEDFLHENINITIMDIVFVNGITILYLENSINYIRLGNLSKKIKGHNSEYNQFSDNLQEKNLLVNYVSQLNRINEDLNELAEIKSELTDKNTIIKNYENQVKLHDDEINFKNSQIDNIDSKLNIKESQIKNVESKLVNREIKINDLENKLQNANTQINSLTNELRQNINNFRNTEIKFNNRISLANSEIGFLKTELHEKESEFSKRETELKNRLEDNADQLQNYKSNIEFKDNLIQLKEQELKDMESSFHSLKSAHTRQLIKADNDEYCISCLKEEIENNHLEIDYLKNDSSLKKIISPFDIIILILKSNPKELSLNFKLYKTLKNSKCFDIGYYLKNNSDIPGSNWCKYFSPELHYVCNGFNEKREFNKKYFNRKSKKELLEHINKYT